MNFFSRELCVKLQAMGLKSESGFQHLPTTTFISHPDKDEEKRANSRYEIIYDLIPRAFGTPSFALLDLCDVSLQARENARILFTRKRVCMGCGIDAVEGNPHGPYCTWGNHYRANFSVDADLFHRHALIDLPNHEAVEEYLWKFIKEAA